MTLYLPTGVLVDPTQSRDPNDMKEDERIAEMGKPRLGDMNKIRVTIKESTEFKVRSTRWVQFYVREYLQHKVTRNFTIR